MLPVGPDTRADIIIIPRQPGGGAALARRDLTVVSAIRYVVEQRPDDERPRAVVRTPTTLLFIDEIEALYDHGLN